MMTKLLNWLGFYSKTQYFKLKAENDKLSGEMYNFDTLLNRYHEGQLNALFYKLVNLCYKDKDKKHLLKRFKERITTATGN